MIILFLEVLLSKLNQALKFIIKFFISFDFEFFSYLEVRYQTLVF
jgi:hypothetical protein